MRKKILPLYPMQPKDDFWGFGEALKIVGKRALMAPTGLLTAMSMIPEEKFEILPLLDANVESVRDEKLLDTKGGYVFSSSMTVHRDSQEEIFSRIKRLNDSLPESDLIKIVVGGPLPTAEPRSMRDANHIISGEAEMTLPIFVEDLLRGDAHRLYTEEGAREKIKNGLTKSGKPDLTQSPIPKWEVVPDLNVYEMLGLQYSRGCPFDCEFCDITTLFGREPRTKSPEQMIAEFDAIYDKNFRGGVFLVDDNFIGNKKNALEFLPELIKWQREKGYPYPITTEASTNLAWNSNRQMLEQMVRSGFKTVFLGIESTNPETLEKMNKTQNLKMSPYEVVKRIQNAGIRVSAGFIVGNDGENEDACESIYEFSQKAGIPFSMAGILNVIPGTRLEARLKREGRLRDREWAGSNTTVTQEMDFEPKFEEGYSEKSFFKDYNELIQNLYSNSKNYFERCKTLRDSLGEKISSGRRSLANNLAIARRYIKHLIKNPDKDAVKYLLETAIKRPRHFVGAISDAIEHIHFKKMAQTAAQDYALIS